MKSLAVILCLFLGWIAVDLPTIREHFRKAKDSQSATESLYNELVGYTMSDPVVLAYKGASQTLKARFEKNRAKKKVLVGQGIKILEESVKTAPDEVEIRLVRLAIQENAPKILKYKANMKEDKQMILSNFAAQSVAVKRIIRQYVAQSDYFSQTEKDKVAE